MYGAQIEAQIDERREKETEKKKRCDEGKKSKHKIPVKAIKLALTRLRNPGSSLY